MECISSAGLDCCYALNVPRSVACASDSCLRFPAQGFLSLALHAGCRGGDPEGAEHPAEGEVARAVSLVLGKVRLPEGRPRADGLAVSRVALAGAGLGQGG